MNGSKSILVGGIIGLAFLIILGVFLSDVKEKLIPTDVDLRVAFIADQGLGPNAIAVLNLIKDEGAQMVLHQGDFDYSGDPDKWDNQISDVLGSDFPYFASFGNHDISQLNGYQEKLYDRLEKNPDAVCNGNLGVDSSCTYKGLFFILAAPGLCGYDKSETLTPSKTICLPDSFSQDYESIIEKQLNDNDFLWRICSWHYDTASHGTIGWEIYEICKNGGAIIANGHEHSYQRTKTLVDIENRIVDPAWSEPNKLRVKEGATFHFVSGLGGHSTHLHSHDIEWTTSYTSDQDATYGALFCTFNVEGQPDKAYCYFKNIFRVVIDEFTIVNSLGVDSDITNHIDVDLSAGSLTEGTGYHCYTDEYGMVEQEICFPLAGTILTGADLTGIDLSGKDLTGTMLTGADLSDANLAGIDLSGKDLTGTILTGADMSQANLTGADLSNSILAGADLSNSNLTGTILTGADLSQANLTSALQSGMDLTGTILTGADMSQTDLTGVNLSGKDLTGVRLAGADLSGSDLTGSMLTGADLSDANLSNAILINAILENATIENAKLLDANLYSANLTNANLKNALLVDVNLINTILTGADLTNAVLTGAVLTGADLSGADLSGVIFGENTILTCKNHPICQMP